MLRWLLIIIAGAYSAVGVLALLAAFVLPSDGPLAAAPALLVGMPWSLILGQLDLDADNLAVGIALVVLAIGINAGLLWWWALSRKR
jgi:hypothetical protein